MRARRFALTLALVAGSLSAPLTAFAQEEAHPTFVAEMTGFEEVPGAATLAKGFAGFQLSMDGNAVYYTITITDASTPLMAAHLHLAPRGEAGEIVVPLCVAPAKPCQTEGVVSQGTFTAADFTGPFANDNLDRLITEARNGMVYVNVHSSKYPSGEARGQLVELSSILPIVEPSAGETPE
jgi:hypothetical protein